MYPRSILAIDATTDVCSVAWTDGSRAVERSRVAGQRHSELVLPMLESVLAEAGRRLHDVSEIAFGAGPGSFTGLRIACGVAQGLALGAGLPVRPVSSLLALAQATGEPAVIAINDARMNEVYWGAYRRDRDGHWLTVSEPASAAPDALELPAGEDWTVAGDGLNAYPQLTTRFSALRIDRTTAISALAIAELALLGHGALTDAADAVPHYVRNKVALTTAERAGAD